MKRLYRVVLGTCLWALSITAGAQTQPASTDSLRQDSTGKFSQETGTYGNTGTRTGADTSTVNTNLRTTPATTGTPTTVTPSTGTGTTGTTTTGTTTTTSPATTTSPNPPASAGRTSEPARSQTGEYSNKSMREVVREEKAESRAAQAEARAQRREEREARQAERAARKADRADKQRERAERKAEKAERRAEKASNKANKERGEYQDNYHKQLP